ncbi:MAG: hypothetical protein U9N46_02140, partial [Euryarchaeota archaeon]|nr:hypothetical protein [Euryarchaeota archaeon]
TRRIQRATYLLSIEDGVTKRNKNGKVLGCGTHPNMESFHHPSVGLPAGFDIDKTRTLGLRLIQILTEDQLQGTRGVISDGGTTFNIEFDIRYDGGVLIWGKQEY